MGKEDALSALSETECRQEGGYQNIWTFAAIMSFPGGSHFRRTERKLIELCAAAAQNTDAPERWYGTNVKIFRRWETNPCNYPQENAVCSVSASVRMLIMKCLQYG